MSMVDAYKAMWKNYAKFSGRARRSEYWWVILAQTLISTAFSLINMAAGDSVLGAVANVVISVYGLATLIPMISLAVRRLHDIEKSGWWYLLNCIPCIGSIILIVFFCKEGTAGSNRYGDDPKVPNVVFKMDSVNHKTVRG